MKLEGVSRNMNDEMKIVYAMYSAREFFSLQHDGVVMGLPEGRNEQDTAKALTFFCSRALGYDQTVHEVKPHDKHDRIC